VVQTTRRFIVIVNPRGGTRRGIAVLETVRPIFAQARSTLEVHVTQSADDARRIAATVDLSVSDGLCIVGGDGTLHDTVDGLMTRDAPDAVPLGLIPGGTGNSVLRHLNCDDPAEAARRIVAGQTKPLDVVRVTMPDRTLHCVNIIGWGAVVEINRIAERLRAIGKTDAGRHVFLVFTIRKRSGKSCIRPVSARYMHRKEIACYEKENPDL